MRKSSRERVKLSLFKIQKEEASQIPSKTSLKTPSYFPCPYPPGGSIGSLHIEDPRVDRRSRGSGTRRLRGLSQFHSDCLSGGVRVATISTKELGVMLGTGVEIRATRVCRQVNLSLTELEIIADFFPNSIRQFRSEFGVPLVSVVRRVTHKLGGYANEVQGWGKKSATPRGSFPV